MKNFTFESGDEKYLDFSLYCKNSYCLELAWILSSLRKSCIGPDMSKGIFILIVTHFNTTHNSFTESDYMLAPEDKFYGEMTLLCSLGE